MEGGKGLEGGKPAGGKFRMTKTGVKEDDCRSIDARAGEEIAFK